MQLGMFGTVAACHHVLGPRHGEWMAAMCGVCLTIRDRAGQAARATVNTDAVAAAVLAADVHGAAGDAPPAVRRAGPCPARGMRTADVWVGTPAALGAGVSLLAAAVAVHDRADDGQLPAARLTQRAARRWADRLDAGGAPALTEAGIDLARVRAALAASRDAERRRSDLLADWTEPVAAAYGAVFAPIEMEEVGRRIGRVTLLADAVADVTQDERDGAPNPVLSGACSTSGARRLILEDVAQVGARVAAALPGSLAALLWGPGFERGVTRTLGGTSGRTCRHEAVVATDAGDAPNWPSATSEPSAGPPTTAARRRRRRRRRCRDACDPCDPCNPCSPCYGCDCCDCCGCDC